MAVRKDFRLGSVVPLGSFIGATLDVRSSLNVTLDKVLSSEPTASRPGLARIQGGAAMLLPEQKTDGCAVEASWFVVVGEVAGIIEHFKLRPRK